MTIRKGLGLLVGLVFGLSAFIFAGPVRAMEMVVNGDFETDADLFVTWPGYVGNGSNPADIPGWTGGGGRGINPVVPGGTGDSPFRDNGDNTTSVAFLQGSAHIEQVIPGFKLGKEYTLSLDFNARDCCGDFPAAEVLLNGMVALNLSDLFPPAGRVEPVGGTNPWYSGATNFFAPDTNVTLRINSAAASSGDATLLLDNISITSTSIPEPTTLTLLGIGLAGLGFTRRRPKV